MEGIYEFFTCLITAMGIASIFGWIGLYRLWNKELRHKPIFTSWLQVLRWLIWLVLVGLVGFASIYAAEWWYLSLFSDLAS
jgi:hypothetical protein